MLWSLFAETSARAARAAHRACALSPLVPAEIRSQDGTLGGDRHLTPLSPTRESAGRGSSKNLGHADTDGDDQDDPENVAEIERLRAKLARHRREAERLAELIRQKEKKA